MASRSEVQEAGLWRMVALELVVLGESGWLPLRALDVE